MKKILAVLLVALFTLIACAATNNSSTSKNTDTKSVYANASTREQMAKSIEEELNIKSDKDKNKKEKEVTYEHYQTGIASYYGGKWHGRKTANGEIFDTNTLTAAHKTLPFNTKVRVTNINNGKSVIVRINNRGPYVKGRIIDLSQAAFSSISSLSNGITRVKLEIVK